MASITVCMDGAITISQTLSIPEWELWFTASLSGGPGGQHVNKTNSKITLHWDIEKSSVLSDYQKQQLSRRLQSRINRDGVFNMSVESERSQHKNKSIAKERFATLVASALKPNKKRIPTRATKASKRRRLDEKKRRSSFKKLRKKIDAGET